ncbi:Uncaracterized surface protein containing fasciclin (FAS1) repeats [Planctomicrobium piriforme]|uniref:Uncaracterized surface protein containing fasciclin (FAS1) repeats n=1 Tax=Planctomicrobium piriforme TaxID=1576369 RepID=A0A1I3J016_9PLAN|nr:fasciclin domain-containing protein [Planctomicrobium piriforme]SFI53597.1 Uncaracterized surface protein containing fasciclin (FAS1) repeats [Planctomicrobium piriforme]
MLLRKFALGLLAVVTLGMSANGLRAAEPATKDIVGVAVEAGSFKTLAAALKAAGLVEALQGPGPFTVFAPTDEAFAALPAGTVENLLKPENKDQLVAILKYHVVAGKKLSKDLVGGQAVPTLQGNAVKVTVVNGEAKVMGAKIVKVDVPASNGVIHVIDKVLIPETKTTSSVEPTHAQPVASTCPSTQHANRMVWTRRAR